MKHREEIIFQRHKRVCAGDSRPRVTITEKLQAQLWSKHQVSWPTTWLSAKNTLSGRGRGAAPSDGADIEIHNWRTSMSDCTFTQKGGAGSLKGLVTKSPWITFIYTGQNSPSSHHYFLKITAMCRKKNTRFHHKNVWKKIYVTSVNATKTAGWTKHHLNLESFWTQLNTDTVFDWSTSGRKKGICFVSAAGCAFTM